MTVHLVAGGPGDPGLWTVRVESLLAAAPVVVVDTALAAAVVPLAGPDTVVVTAASADEAAALVVTHGQRHDGVVRVATGDRLVWEAGGVEAAALARAGLDAEVVPAVLAAFAGPASAGIPVMTRPLAASLTVALGVAPPAVAGGTVVGVDGPAVIDAASGPAPVIVVAGGHRLAVTGAVAGLRLDRLPTSGGRP